MAAKITKSGRYDLPLAEYLGQPCDSLSMSSSDAVLLTGLATLNAALDRLATRTGHAPVSEVLAKERPVAPPVAVLQGFVPRRMWNRIPRRWWLEDDK